MLRASKTGKAAYPQFFTNQAFYEAFIKDDGKLIRMVGPFADPKLGASPIALFVRIQNGEGKFDGIAIALIDSAKLAERIGSYSPDLSVVVTDYENRIVSGVRDGKPMPASALGVALPFSPASSSDGRPGIKYVPAGEGQALTLVTGVVSGATGAVASVLLVAVMGQIHRQLAGPSPEGLARTFD